MSGEHARLAPSSAPQWSRCAGSVIAQEAIPDVETEATREGTAAHWVASETLTAYLQGRGSDCGVFEDSFAPNGVAIDEKVVEGAQIFVDDVVAVVEKFQAQKQLLVEHRVQMPFIHPTDNWGTLDASIYLPRPHVLYLWDYKHGHRECNAEDNPQMVDYLNGLCELYRIDGRMDQVTTVIVRIVQPFCYTAVGPIKEWVFKLSDLRGHWNNLRLKAAEALGPSPTLSTGVWCRDCKAVGTCSAARQAGYNLVDLAGAPYSMDAMTGADLAVERDILSDGLAVLKARLEAIEDNLGHRLRKGESDSGLVLEATRGREGWTIPPEQVISLCNQFGVDASKQAVKTPVQARAAAPKAVRDSLSRVIEHVTHRKAGQLKLTRDTGTKAARAFHKRT